MWDSGLSRAVFSLTALGENPSWPLLAFVDGRLSWLVFGLVGASVQSLPLSSHGHLLPVCLPIIVPLCKVCVQISFSDKDTRYIELEPILMTSSHLA